MTSAPSLPTLKRTTSAGSGERCAELEQPSRASRFWSCAASKQCSMLGEATGSSRPTSISHSKPISSACPDRYTAGLSRAGAISPRFEYASRRGP